MSDSFDPERQKRMLQNAQQSEPSGPGWTPLSAAAVNSTFAASSDFTQYEIIEPLGHGGMGAVHRGRDTKTSREVAVKLLRHDALHDNAFVTRFKKESHNLRRVNHHNVVRVFDEGEVEGYPFFVMELLEGHTLASEIERSGRMPLADIRRIMGDICSGLQAVHEEGLVHRDLKAANIFLVNDGRVVILDFGLARDVTAKPSTLSVAGSEGHIAPEVLRGEPATQLSDIFSGGVIYLHLLTGTIPRGGQVQLHETYGLDPRLDAIVKKACNEDPKGRYPSAREFAEAIKAATSPVPPRPVEPVSPPLRRDNPSSSPAPAKTKEKTGDTGSSTSTAPIPKDIVFPPEARLQLHRDYLFSWKPSKPPKTWQSTSISEDESWEVIDQWNAFPEIPPFEEVERKVDLRFKFSWTGGALGFGLALILMITIATKLSLDWLGVLIGIAVGGFFLASGGFTGAGWLFDQLVAPLGLSAPSVWDWDDHPLTGTWWKESRSTFGAGFLDSYQLLWHPYKPHLFATRDHYHLTGWQWSAAQNTDGTSHSTHEKISGTQSLFSSGWIKNIFFSDEAFLSKSESFWRWQENAATKHWVLYNSWGHLQTKISGGWSYLFSDDLPSLRSNPWRPKHNNEIIFYSYGDVVLSVYHVANFPKLLYPGTGPSLEEFAKETIKLANIQVSDRETIISSAWHPSGLYLALEISGRLHLLQWDFAEHVMYPEQGGEKYEAVAWSPDGMLLAIDRQLKQVWDIRTNEIRPLALHERWDYRPAGSLDNQLMSCDGLRSFSSHQGGPNFPIKDWQEVTDIAWSPDDPDVFATVGGKGCPRDIRIWQRVK